MPCRVKLVGQQQEATVSDLELFPSIKKAALIIAYSNGMIYHDVTQEEFLDKVQEILGADGVYHEDLVLFDAWLGKLTDELLLTVCDGEVGEAFKISKTCPRNKDGYPMVGILDDIFNV